MSRVKGSKLSNKKRKNTLSRAKGYRGVRSKKERYANEAVMRAGRNAFAHRKDRKTAFRQLWIVRLNAAVRDTGHQSYSTFINKLKKNGFALDRKTLAYFAAENPEVFARISKQVV